MSADLDLGGLAWPETRTREAVIALARKSGLISAEPTASGSSESSKRSQAQIRAVIRELGFGYDPVQLRWGDVADFLELAGPAIFRVRGQRQLFTILSSNGVSVRVLTPDSSIRRVSHSKLKDALMSMATPLADSFSIDQLTELLGRVPTQHGIATLRSEVCAPVVFGAAWLLRSPDTEPLLRQFAHARIGRTLVVLGVLVGTMSIVSSAAFLVFGKAALDGRADLGMVWPWGLALLSLIPLRLGSSWLQATLLLRVSTIVRKRIFEGALRVEPERIASYGIGTLLAKTHEAEALETSGLMGALGLVTAFFDVAVAVWLAIHGPQPLSQALLLTGAIAAICWISMLRMRRFTEWTEIRMRCTRDLVDKMIGHRTRIVQQAPEFWHRGEDELLSEYHERFERLDNSTIALTSIPRAWMVASAALLVIAMVGPISGLDATIGVVALIFGSQALSSLTPAIRMITRLWVAIRQLEPIARAPVAEPTVERSDVEAAIPDLIAQVDEVSYQYPSTERDVIGNAHALVHVGDRILLTGPSGGGKSTLLRMLCGLQIPSHGTVQLGGVDSRKIDDEYRNELVSLAPQFHENMIFSNSLAFNLLMGRAWPASEEDLSEARTVCGELGLQPLLARMPLGLDQPVGETGWQLSHGEKSRVYVARALLQGSRMVAFDESFGALDPETLELCIDTALRRGRTIVLAAHP